MAKKINNLGQKIKHERMLRIAKGLRISESYEYSDAFVPYNKHDVLGAHTILELVECLEHYSELKIEARVLGYNDKGEVSRIRMNKGKFLESLKGNKNRKFKEAVDYFSTDSEYNVGSSVIGSEDFVPLLGGPFYKNLYY